VLGCAEVLFQKPLPPTLHNWLIFSARFERFGFSRKTWLWKAAQSVFEAESDW
jgi:hypothetical protein